MLFWVVFFFNDTATTEIYTLSLHDALPISGAPDRQHGPGEDWRLPASPAGEARGRPADHRVEPGWDYAAGDQGSAHGPRHRREGALHHRRHASPARLVAQKKSLRAIQHDRPEVPRHPIPWRVWQRYMDADRFVFLDETSATTAMTRPSGDRKS